MCPSLASPITVSERGNDEIECVFASQSVPVQSAPLTGSAMQGDALW